MIHTKTQLLRSQKLQASVKDNLSTLDTGAAPSTSSDLDLTCEEHHPDSQGVLQLQVSIGTPQGVRDSLSHYVQAGHGD